MTAVAQPRLARSLATLFPGLVLVLAGGCAWWLVPPPYEADRWWLGAVFAACSTAGLTLQVVVLARAVRSKAPPRGVPMLAGGAVVCSAVGWSLWFTIGQVVMGPPAAGVAMPVWWPDPSWFLDSSSTPSAMAAAAASGTALWWWSGRPWTAAGLARRRRQGGRWVTIEPARRPAAE